MTSTLARTLAGVAGALAVNALPHGTAAVLRRPFPSIFAEPPGRGMSTPGENAAWSAINAGGAVVAGGLALRRDDARDLVVPAAVGAAVMAVVIVRWFGPIMREAAAEAA
ncbi:hypothetical protein QQX09_08265 [Demequina sp. SYSU T00192]|uniref:Uncharacterized protein n=1 Tax=Demequina litoralis TaxID=3051660 RepID=A0ABT8G9P4_9MICO|nr:hypothetical protein [Demequina sp. SYSU T00192]MDN4475850.1 hypothetical protein [Demequina sp. SYSU T00192]